MEKHAPSTSATEVKPQTGLLCTLSAHHLLKILDRPRLSRDTTLCMNGAVIYIRVQTDEQATKPRTFPRKRAKSRNAASETASPF